MELCYATVFLKLLVTLNALEAGKASGRSEKDVVGILDPDKLFGTQGNVSFS